MTSKISYFKLWREELRHQTALIFVTVFAFVLELVSFVLSVQNTITAEFEYGQARYADAISYTKGAHTKELIGQLTRLCQPQWLLALITVGLAVYSAFSGFHFLHSKRQMDFYGALPVTRSRKFAVLAGSQFSIFVIPLFAAMLIRMLVITMMGYADPAIMRNIGFTLLCSVVIFFVTWAFAVLAMTLTGHTFIAALGFGVFSVYVPLILRYLIPSYQSTFFETYVTNRFGSEAWNYFSPASLTYRMISHSHRWQFADHSKWIVISVLVAVVVSFLTYILFLKRPSETAGRAIVFSEMKVPLRFALVIPMALYAGLYLSMLSWNIDKTWLIVGVIIGVIVFHVIVEWIYEFNIRAVFSRKLDMAVTLACCFLFVLFFWMDIGGYDSYVPKASEVKNAVIFTDNLSSIYNQDKYQNLPQMPEEVIEDVLAFAEYVVKERDASDGESSYTDSIRAVYVMKNGTIKCRHYAVKEDLAYGLFEKCFNTPEYKQAIYPIYQTDISQLDAIQFYAGSEKEEIVLQKDKEEEFLNLYLEELKNVTFQEICESAPVSAVDFGMSGGWRERNYIYSSFEKTIEFLTKNNIPLFDLSKYTVKQASISVWDEDYINEHVYIITDEALLNSYRDKYRLAGVGYYYDWEKETEIINAVIENESESWNVELWTDKETAELLLQSVK